MSPRECWSRCVAAPRLPPFLPNNPERYRYAYCANPDPSVLVRGARNAPRPPGDDTAGPPPSYDPLAQTDPTPQVASSIPTPFGGPATPVRLPRTHLTGPDVRLGPDHRSRTHCTEKEATMATKLFKRTNTKNVFDMIVEQADPPSAETLENTTDVENTTDAADSETSETADSTPSIEDANTAEAHDDDSDGADEQPSTPSRRKRWLRRFIIGAVGVLFVAALGSSGFLGWQLKQQKDVNAASRAALAAAQSYAVVLTSIDTNGVDKNFARVVDNATGEFKDMYSQSASQLRQALIDNKTMSKGIVVDSAIKSATKTKVEVLLFVDQWISNVVTPQPRMDRSRVAMTMELVDGRWLASKVELK